MKTKKFECSDANVSPGLALAQAVVYVFPLMFIDDGLRQVWKTQVGSKRVLSFMYDGGEQISLAFIAEQRSCKLFGGYVLLIRGAPLTGRIQEHLISIGMQEAEDFFVGLPDQKKVELTDLADSAVELDERAVVSQVLGSLLYDVRAASGGNLLGLITPIIQGLRERNKLDEQVGEFDE